MIRSLLLITGLCTLQASAQDGALDLDFSADGLQVTAAAEYSSTAYDVAQLPNGYLLVAGDTRVSAIGGGGVAVVKYVPDGELDASFGSNAGIQQMVTGEGTVQTCRRMAVLDDGGILLAGSSQQEAATQTKVLLVRLHPDGSPDHAFAVAGLAHVAVGELWTNVEDMAVQPDGKILVTGSFTEGGTTSLFLARVKANGGWGEDPLDLGFAGGTGYTTLTVGSNTRGHAMSIDEEGNILVLGVAFMPTARFLLARYLPDGTPDTNFGTDGRITFDPVLSNAATATMAKSGDSYYLCGKTADDLIVCHVNADGALDTDWGVAGTVLLDGSNWSATNTSGLIGLAVQADGKLLIANGRPNTTGGGAIIARLHMDGSLDDTFGTDGLVINTTGQHFDRVMIQQDHRIVAVGKALDDGLKFFTARVHSGITTAIADAAIPTTNANVLPNPVHDRCEIGLVLEHAKRLTAVVHDAQGRAVRTLFSNEPFVEGAQRRAVDLPGMAPGAYLLVLSDDNGRLTSTRLIKQ